MSDPFDLPPDTERFSHARDRLAFRIEGSGTRRLVRIARIAHVEQALTVVADHGAGEIVLRQRYAGEGAVNLKQEDAVRIGMAPEEARAVAASLVAAADAIDASAVRQDGERMP